MLAMSLSGPPICRYRVWTGHRWQDYNLPCPPDAKPGLYIRPEPPDIRPEILVDSSPYSAAPPAGEYVRNRRRFYY